MDAGPAMDETWQEQFDEILFNVADHLGRDADDLRVDDNYTDAYYDAFGAPGHESAHEIDGIHFDSMYDYALFLADWLDYDHDQIDEALGYGDD